MHRAVVLLAAVALVASGCGSSAKDSAGATATTSPDHAATQTQQQLLAKALAEFTGAASGRYESEVTADGLSQPTAHETGSYWLEPSAASYERAILGIDESSKKPRVQVVRVRSTADGQWFLQLKEWGSWTGCWLRMDLPEITRLTGVGTAGNSRLPTAVTILAKAEVVGSGDGMDGPHLAVDAYAATQFLGVTSSATAPYRTALAQVAVPVLLDVTADGAPSGAAVEGGQVVTALKAAGVQVSARLSAFIAKTHARVVLRDLGQPVRVTAPARAELLPRNPVSTSTCPANR